MPSGESGGTEGMTVGGIYQPSPEGNQPSLDANLPSDSEDLAEGKVEIITAQYNMYSKPGLAGNASLEVIPSQPMPQPKPDGSVEVTPENPMINTQDNNVSTFSADVDTAAYAYFRKMVQSYGYGLTELRNSGGGFYFRTEEFINYFKYDVTQPRDGELFGVHTEIAPCPWNPGSHLLRLTLQAETAKNATSNNLVFLIDVSGSMQSEDKLPLLKEAFAYLIDNLGADDRISIVTYSGSEAVVLDGCRGNDRLAILNAIQSLTAYGSTNGEAGLTMAYRLAEKHFIAGGNNRIIMASDGDLNVGISTAEELTKFVEEKRGQGVYLSVLGFGTGNYRDGNMEALADNGNGVYYYIDGLSEAEKVFGTDLLGTLYTVAEDVKLQLTFDKELVESYRLIGYENRVMSEEEFRDDTKDAGEVGASHQVTVCYEIKLASADAAVLLGRDYMTLAVRYKNPGEPIARENSYGIGWNEMTDGRSEDMRFISAVIELSMLLRSSEYAKDVTIQDVYAQLEGLYLTDPYKIEFRELVQSLVK